VQFGSMMETTRAALQANRRRDAPWWRRAFDTAAYRLVLPRHAVLLVVTWFLLVAQRLRLIPRRFALPKLLARSLARPLDIPVGGAPSAWLFTGCVMDAWLRDTHRATARVMRATGATIARPGPSGACCGALHVHAGRRDEARQLARRVMVSMPGDAPIVVNSAGCGAAMKDYGALLGTPEATTFAGRVRDFAEWLAEQPPLPVRDTGSRVVVQDPCHLRHVQRAHLAVRSVLRDAYDLVELDDDGLCCGAGGAYAAEQPEIAGEIRDRKAAAIRRATDGTPAVVASANPGCMLHLRVAGFDVRHPAELIADVLDG
jgi:glycolate oxidase iron-sulfur subunit